MPDRSNQDKRRGPALSGRLPDGPRHPRARRRALVVDDDPISRNIVRDQLASCGFEVEASENAHAALEKIRRQSYDFLILDVFLPHRDGRALHGSVLSFDPDLARRTIFMSHWEPAGPIAEYIGTHGQFLKKPFTSEDLMRAIGRAEGSVGRALSS